LADDDVPEGNSSDLFSLFTI